MKNINLSPARLRSLDPQDMLGKTLELPAQIYRGIQLGWEFLDRYRLEAVSELEWSGLGGSAVAGDLLQAMGYERPHIPLRITVNRYPKAPLGKRLVCSYSGYTAEALQAFTELAPAQRWMTMSSGGRLAELAGEAEVPHLTLPGGYPPRAAVGFGLGAMMAIFDGLYGSMGAAEVEALLPTLETDARHYGSLNREENPALRLAASLIDRTPVVYTCDGETTPALSLRFRAQLAENSKVWSHAAFLPEMAHNEVEAFAFLGQILPPPVVILLGEWPLAHQFPDPRPGLQSLLDEIRVQNITLDPCEIWATNGGRAQNLLRMMLLLDAATIWLAVLRAEDPAVIPTITRLKKALPAS